MRGILETLGLPDEDDCVVPIENSPPVIGFQSDTPNDPQQEQSPEPQEPVIGFQSDTPNEPLQDQQESPAPQPLPTSTTNTNDNNPDPVIGFQQTAPDNPQQQEQQSPAPPPTVSTTNNNNGQRPVDGQEQPQAGNLNQPSAGGGSGGNNSNNKQSNNNGYSDDSGSLSGFNPDTNSFDEDAVANTISRGGRLGAAGSTQQHRNKNRKRARSRIGNVNAESQLYKGEEDNN